MAPEHKKKKKQGINYQLRNSIHTKHCFNFMANNSVILIGKHLWDKVTRTRCESDSSEKYGYWLLMEEAGMDVLVSVWL